MKLSLTTFRCHPSSILSFHRLAVTCGLLLFTLQVFPCKAVTVIGPGIKTDTLVILAFGQSNSACFGQGSYTPSPSVVEFHEGNFIKAVEPLKGAAGNGGCSVWTRLADKLVSDGYCTTVVIVAIGIGSTTVDDWSTGKWAPRLEETLRQLQQHPLDIDLVVWHQGESDNLINTTAAHYENSLNTLRNTIGKYTTRTPMLVCRASYHPEMIGIKPDGVDTAIREAQNNFILKYDDVYAGPDTDLYNRATDRHDGVHFSRIGLERFANDLLTAISMVIK